MPIVDVDTPYSDGWWVRHLTKKLYKREKRRNDETLTQVAWFDVLWDYFTGEPPLPGVNSRHRAATKAFLRQARANFALLTVEAMLDRITFQGIRTEVDDDNDGDDTARTLTEANGAAVTDALLFAFVLGRGYLMVTGRDTEQPVMTAQDPRTMITAPDRFRPHVARAALSVHRDEEARQDVVHLFLPAGNGFHPVTGEPLGDRVRIARRSSVTGLSDRFTAGQWEWDDVVAGEEHPEVGVLPVQGRGVPVYLIENRLGLGEFEPHLDVLNRINNQIADRLWTSKFQTYRQLAMKRSEGTDDDAMDDYEDDEGSERASDAETARESKGDDNLLEADPGTVWDLPPGVDIWESGTTDLTPMLSAAKDDVKELSAVTRTPLYMYAPDAVSGSAEGASLSREGLVFKCEDRQKRVTAAVAAAHATLLAFAQQPKRANGAIEVMWAQVERYSMSQRAESARAAKETGVPQEDIWTDFWQATPEQVARWKKHRASDLLYAGLTDGPSSGTPAS